MHSISLLKNWLRRNQVIGHLARLRATLRVVEAVLGGSKLALTHLGRRRPGDAFVKHHIKAVDRLLGNRHLHRERTAIYSALTRTVLGGLQRPLIVVDWADCELERQLLILRAAVPLGGRAFTLYEEVHPLSRYNSPKTHRRFLRALRDMLPAHCRPIIVTDAGFRGPWFRDVEALGWDWIGRIRNTIKYFNSDTGRWCYVYSLYPRATPKVQHLGERVLAKRHRYHCRLYLLRAYQRGPGTPRKRKSYGTNDGLYRKLHRAPWLIATSLLTIETPVAGSSKPIRRGRRSKKLSVTSKTIAGVRRFAMPDRPTPTASKSSFSSRTWRPSFCGLPALPHAPETGNDTSRPIPSDDAMSSPFRFLVRPSSKAPLFDLPATTSHHRYLRWSALVQLHGSYN